MRCTILAVGSRGDVQPLIALGTGLGRAGLRVRLATHRDYAGAVEAAGLEFAPIEGRAAHFSAGPAGRAFRDRVGNAEQFRRFVENYLTLFLERFYRDAWDASADADVVLSWTACAASLAERLAVPVFNVGLTPALTLPTGAFPNPFHASSDPGDPIANRRTWRLGLPTLRIGERQLNAWRTGQLGLAPITWRRHLRALRRLPHLFGYSPLVLPRPADWPAWASVPGYWFLDEEGRYELPDALAAFLAAGPPPMAIGFSSQVSGDAATMTRTVVDAVARAGERAVIVTGFGGLGGGACPPNVLPVATVPYDWLLPRVHAMVHQGGAGSTGAAVRAGRPQLAVPFGFDQGLWGQRIHELGIGPAPIPANTLTVDNLAAALVELRTNASMAGRAAALGRAVGAEDGIGAAVSIVLDAVERRRAVS